MINQHNNNTVNPRNTALQAFTKIANNIENTYDIDFLLKKELLHNQRDYSFVLNIIEGTYKNIILIDYYINYLIDKKSKLPEIIKNILRISLYQIEFMNSVPESAAINEGVNLAKNYGHKGTSGLVNAVLRNFLRKRHEILNSIEELNFNKRISIKYSYPLWIIDYWLKFLPEDKVLNIAESMYHNPSIYIRINTLQISIEKFCDELKNNNISFTLTDIPELIKLDENINIKTIYGFDKGYFYVQDLSAASVINYIDPKEGENIIDFCAFPGGKTSFISQRMNNTGKILALDISEKRKARFLENINRLGCKNIELVIQSGEEKIDTELKFDKVLVDPPCSGLGVIRRKPDIKYIRKEQDIQRLSGVQYDILVNASKYLKDGGTLIYSTCTISKTENEDIIEKFLLENKNFYLSKINNNDYLNIYPYEYNSDGFFIAKLIKK